MNRRDKTKGGAPAATRGHRPNASAASPAATITASIVQGPLQPARGGAWLLVAQCPYCEGKHAHGAPEGAQTREERRLSHCAGAAGPHRVIVTPEGAE